MLLGTYIFFMKGTMCTYRHLEQRNGFKGGRMYVSHAARCMLRGTQHAARSTLGVRVVWMAVFVAVAGNVRGSAGACCI